MVQEPTLGGLIKEYFRATAAYWWVLVPGFLMPLRDLIASIAKKEGQDRLRWLALPKWVELAILFAFLSLAQFLAYRNTRMNLATVIEEKKQYSINVNSLESTLSARDQEIKDLKGMRPTQPTQNLKPAQLVILYQNKKLDGQILAVIPKDGNTFTLDPIQARNDGDENTKSPPTFRAFFSEPTTTSPGIGWQAVGKSEEEPGFQSELFWGGGTQPVSAHESWFTTTLYGWLTGSSKRDVRVRIKVFYGGRDPTVVNFTLTHKQSN